MLWLKDTEISTESTPIMMWAGDIVIDGQQDNAINMVDIMYMQILQCCKV